MFCDTSTLSKYYLREAESEAVRSLFLEETEVVLSELSRAELMAVFHRRWRAQSWTQEQFTRAIRQFCRDDIGGYWIWLRLDSVIVEQAVKIYATLPEKVSLRSADCLHLVTALHHGFEELYTHDVHQAQAAEYLGLKALRI